MGQGHDEPRWPEGTPPAEKLLYERVRGGLPDEVAVLNNVMLTVPRKGRPDEVEADLVIIDPAFGVIVVEVKGGTLSYDAPRAEWRRAEAGGEAVRDPVQQVKKARSTIRDALAQARFPMEEIALRWVVATPECVLDGPGAPILPPQCVWDARDLGAIDTAVRRVQDDLVLGEAPLGEVRAQAIARVLRGRSVEGRPSTAGQVHVHQQRIHAWSASHRDVISQFTHHRRVLVRGAAGTGKTVLAVEVAARFAAQGDRVLLTCWHRLLAEDLRRQLAARLEEMGSPAATAVTADPAGRVVVGDLAGLTGAGDPPSDVERHDWYTQHLPDRLDLDRTGGPFDLLVLDEAQDPSDLWLLALAGLLRDEGRWYAFADRQQDLFGTAGSLGDFIETDHLLRENFRNSIEIADVAGMFGDVEPDCVTGHGPPVRFVAVPADRVVGRVREIARKLCRDEGYSPADVAAIWLFHNPWQGDPEGLLAQHRQGEMVTTNSAAFKGMERNVVVLGLDLRPDRTAEEHRRSIYVATSRARSQLVVVGDPDQLRADGHYLMAGLFAKASRHQPADDEDRAAG